MLVQDMVEHHVGLRARSGPAGGDTVGAPRRSRAQRRRCVLVLPLVHGSFQSVIFPSEDGGIVVCMESGLMAMTATDFRRIAYVHAGDDPYTVMQVAYLAARVHLGMFSLEGSLGHSTAREQGGTWPSAVSEATHTATSLRPAMSSQPMSSGTRGRTPLTWPMLQSMQSTDANLKRS